MLAPLFTPIPNEPVNDRFATLVILIMLGLPLTAWALNLGLLRSLVLFILLAGTRLIVTRDRSVSAIFLSLWHVVGTTTLLLHGSFTFASLYCFALFAILPRAGRPRSLSAALLAIAGLLSHAPSFYYLSVVVAVTINLERFMQWREGQETLLLLNAQSRAIKRLRFTKPNQPDVEPMTARPLFGQHERYAMLGRIIAGFSRDVMPQVELSQEHTKKKDMAALTQSLGQIHTLLSTLTRVSRPPAVDTASAIFLPYFVDKIRALMSAVTLPCVSITIDDAPRVWVQGHPEHLHQAFTLLMTDLWQVVRLEETQKLLLHLRVHEQWAQITLDFHGAGLTELNLNRLFEPYYTSQKSGFGAGLNLALAQSYLLAMDGHLSIERHLDRGLRLTIHLNLSKHDGRATQLLSTGVPSEP